MAGCYIAVILVLVLAACRGQGSKATGKAVGCGLGKCAMALLAC